MPLGDTQRPPWGGSDEICSNSKCARYHSHDPTRKYKEIQEAQMNFVQTQKVPDIIPMLLQEKNEEIQSQKHRGDNFAPG